MTPLPRLLIYRDHLLGASETFVKAQGEHLSRYVPHYLGAKRITGLPLPDDRVTIVNESGGLGRISEILMKAIGIAPRVERQVRYIAPILVHAHFGIDAALVLPFIRRLKVPLVVTFHGYDITTSDAALRRGSRAQRVYLARRRTLMANTRLFIAVSQFIKDRMLAAGFPEERTVVHYTGVDTDLFSADPVIPREPVVLFVGRLVEKKGARYLIEAMHDVQRRCPGSRLVIVGGGPLEASLKDLALRLDVTVEFCGAQPPELIRQWMNRARVFCVPSITADNGDAEGFGMVFAEAQAMGLPVVSTRSGGIPEAVQDGRTGLLCDERNAKQLADAICHLLSNEAIWRSLSERGQHFARTAYSVVSQCAKLERLYDAASQPPGSSPSSL